MKFRHWARSTSGSSTQSRPWFHSGDLLCLEIIRLELVAGKRLCARWKSARNISPAPRPPRASWLVHASRRLEALAAEIVGTGSDARAVDCDVADEALVIAAYDAANARFGAPI
jgi:hypothetical protein